LSTEKESQFDSQSKTSYHDDDDVLSCIMLHRINLKPMLLLSQCPTLLMAVAHQIIIDPSEAFITSLCGGGLSPSRTQSLPKTKFLFDAAAASSSDNGAKEGGTEWIKDSIGTSNNNSSSSQPETSSPPSQRLEFSIV
jgi:hypothetical protein